MVLFLYTSSETRSVKLLTTVVVEKAVTVAVMFWYLVEAQRQVELLVGCGIPLVPVPELYHDCVDVELPLYEGLPVPVPSSDSVPDKV
jgi:hypothetical protein